MEVIVCQVNLFFFFICILTKLYPIAWFDIAGLDRASIKAEDEKGMLSSITSGKKNFPKKKIANSFYLVNRFIREEVDNGIPANRIVIGGFSQGCVLSLLAGLTSEYKLAAIVGCSGWLGLSDKIASVRKKFKMLDIKLIFFFFL